MSYKITIMSFLKQNKDRKQSRKFDWVIPALYCYKINFLKYEMWVVPSVKCMEKRCIHINK